MRRWMAQRISGAETAEVNEQGGTNVEMVWVTSLLALWVVVLLMAFLLAGALRQLGLIALRLGDDPGPLITREGLERGSQAPAFTAIDAETGDRVDHTDLESRARMIVFLSPSCVACRNLIVGLNEVVATRGNEFDFLVICRDTAGSCRDFARLRSIRPRVLVDADGEIERRFEVDATPFAYLVDYEGRVLLRGIVNNWQQLDAMLEQEGNLQRGEASLRREVVVHGNGVGGVEVV